MHACIRLQIVLRITNTTEYTPAMIESTNGPKGVDFNGLSGQFGIINVLSDTSVKLKFEFINTTDESPYTLEGLYFSWFDLDQGPTGNRQEKVGQSAWRIHRCIVYKCDAPVLTLSVFRSLSRRLFWTTLSTSTSCQTQLR